MTSDLTGLSCPTCGAPVDVTAVVSDSGWEQQPALADMARVQFGQSRLQIEGNQVPVADFTLDADEQIYFPHHVLLWRDESSNMTNRPNSGAWNRMLAGMPLYMLDATGPGHVALSENSAGEVIALPLNPGMAIWVREHRFLAASSAVDYTFQSSGLRIQTGNGTDSKWHYPLGMYDDVFKASEQPGLLLLHAPGNTFFRDLGEGETMLVQPTALLYKDLSVQMQLHVEYPASSGGFSGMFNRYSHRKIWVRLIGPGRVAVQSMFEHEEESEPITGGSFTTQRW